ncbi:MAG: leucine-rich repeat domain-containing protein [Promethearchaeota archaeon]
MRILPKYIYQKYKHNEIDKNTTIKMLISIIENSDSQEIRKEGITFLEKFDFQEYSEVFTFLENIMLSDGDSDLKISAARVLHDNFPREAIKPFKWMIARDLDYDSTVNIIDLLAHNDEQEVKDLLIEELNRIVKNKALDKFANYYCDIFQDSISRIKEDRGINNIRSKELARILIQFKTMDINARKIGKIPFNLDNNSLISSLDLKMKNLGDLREIKGLKKLTSLQTLQLSHNSLDSLPDFIGDLTTLQTLNISHNDLMYLPESFGNLTSLQTLDLGNNDLKSLPESFGNLTSLQTLDLGNNDLKSLPESFGNLTSLKVLLLQDNQLRSLSGSFSKLSSLGFFNLESNQLMHVPKSVGALRSLQVLDLGKNRIRSLSKINKLFINLSELKVLNLHQNKLKRLKKSLNNFPSLHTLDLHGNKIKNFSRSFRNLTSLRLLNLEENRFSEKRRLNSKSVLERLLGNEVEIIY